MAAAERGLASRRTTLRLPGHQKDVVVGRKEPIKLRQLVGHSVDRFPNLSEENEGELSAAVSSQSRLLKIGVIGFKHTIESGPQNLWNYLLGRPGELQLFWITFGIEEKI